jgi:quercetin 2,3-dioxygenase
MATSFTEQSTTTQQRIHMPAGERGHTQISWLNSYHSFSFGEYHNPASMAFGALRVINEDTVAPGGGFGTHAHRDMEIISIALEGAVEHKDSIGNGSIIRPGDVQKMSAGTGVQHSEFNPSSTEAAHFLQIWIIPEKAGFPPSYEQKHFPETSGQLQLVASRDGQDGSVTIHQDALLYQARLNAGQRIATPLQSDRRYSWV